MTFSDRLEGLAELVVRRRWMTVLLILATTIVLMASMGRLAIVIDPDQTLPQDHPFQIATNLADRLFGNKLAVVIGITPREGDALQPRVLAAVRDITNALGHDPGVVRGNLASLAAAKVKDIDGSEDGLAVGPLMARIPTDEAGRAALLAALARNPVYEGLLLSHDRRTAAIVADFRKDAGGFRAIAARVGAIVAPFRTPEMRIEIAGQPILLGLTEVYSDRVLILFPLALVVIGLIHFEAFRSWQGLLLPLVTGLVATGWALGIMGWTGTPLDAFNASTPILILAVAAGHAVQILKRYYEEYALALRPVGGTAADPMAANRRAIVRAVAVTGPVMVAAGLTAAISFSSLMVFRIGTIRTFGLFTAVGILSALVIELTLIPALRAILPPPGPRQVTREAATGLWDRLAGLFARLAIGRPDAVLIGSLLFVALALGGAALLRVDNTLRSYFLSSLEVRQDDRLLNAQLAGNNVLSIVVQGPREDAIKSPAVLRAMAATQRFLEREPAVGKTVSLADFIHQIDRAVNADPDPARPLPDQQDLIAQYLLLYSISGSPGDFDSYVDAGYRNAVITAYLKEESSAYLEDLARRLRVFVAQTFPPDIKVLIGGNVMSSVALTEVLVGNKMINIAQIGLAVFVISSLLFRSLVGGVLVLLPLVLAVAANFGLMGWTGIPLQVATATVSAMGVGIGADYAIYLLYRLREEARLADPQTAMERTFRSAGKAVMFVATAIAGGYAVMMLSWGFLIHFWLGLLISAAMVVSAGAALLTLPALIMKLRPAFLFAPVPAAPDATIPDATIPGATSSGATAARRASLLALLALAAAPCLATAAWAQTPAAGLSAEAVMRRNFVATKVADTAADAIFTLISADGQQRVRQMRSWTRLREDGVSNMRLARFLSPADVRGTATLTVENPAAEDDIWIYLPALKRIRRLLAANKKDSYVGTDFSYGDIIGFKVEEWRHAILRRESVDGVPCYVVESVPLAADAAETSGYGRRLQWIRADNFVTVKGENYDVEGRLWKSFAVSDLRVADAAHDRWQPMRFESRDLLSGHRTIIQLENFRANQGLDAAMFNPRVLDREP